MLADLSVPRLASLQRTVPLRHLYSTRVERLRVMLEPYDGIVRLCWAGGDDMRLDFEGDEALTSKRLLVEHKVMVVDKTASCGWVAAAVWQR